MSETTPNDRTDDVSDELRETGDDVSRKEPSPRHG